MSQLEPCYLANVILYLHSIDSIIKFKCINTKCQEATKMIRYFKPLQLMDEEYYCCERIIPSNILEIFPQLETISCNWLDLTKVIEVSKKICQIKLVCTDTIKPQNIEEEIRNKVIELDIHYPTSEIGLHYFKNVRVLRIEGDFSFNLFLESKDIVLDKLIIRTFNAFRLKELKDYKNIRRFIFYILRDFEVMSELKKFATVVLCGSNEEVDFRDCIFPLNPIRLFEQQNINEIYDLTAFLKCNVLGSCDLRHCELLESVIGDYFGIETLKSNILVEGLTNLKEIKKINEMDCLPQSVTKLCLFDSFNIDNFSKQQKDKRGMNFNTFENIKYLEIESRYGLCLESNVLLQFINCEKMYIAVSEEQIDAFQFPTNLSSLTLVNVKSSEQLLEIGKLKNLKKLTLTFMLRLESNKEITSSIQKVIEKLSSLFYFKTNIINNVKIPSHISELSIQVSSIVDLSQYHFLKRIELSSFGLMNYCPLKVKLPRQIECLTILGEIEILNIPEVEIDELVLIRSNSLSLGLRAKKLKVKNGAFLPKY